MTRYLVTGASGLLGINFALRLSAEDEVVGLVHQNRLSGVPFQMLTADLSNPARISDILAEVQPDVVIHCAALANLDSCELHPQEARHLNSDLPGELAVATHRLGIRLVHFSTDAVFDGHKGDYSEGDEPSPINVYGRTKLEGERAVQAANPDAIIARVNFYGWSLTGKRSLAEWFVNNLSVGQTVNGFKDVYFTPLWVNDLIDLTLEMLQKKLSGLYHVLGRDSLSKFDFGVAIASQFGLDENLILPANMTRGTGSLLAPRSPNLSGRTDKLARDLGHAMPDLLPGMRHFYQQFQAGYPFKLQTYLVPADADQ
jgi:dTDP-4-dehydrorhamnose reductase